LFGRCLVNPAGERTETLDVWVQVEAAELLAARGRRDTVLMSALEVIDQIKRLSPDERAQVARFVVKDGPEISRRFTVTEADDGLPVIRANGEFWNTRVGSKISGPDTYGGCKFSIQRLVREYPYQGDDPLGPDAELEDTISPHHRLGGP